jgi:hypothetical protein
VVARRFGFQEWTGPRRQDFSGAGRIAGSIAANITSDPTAGIGGWTDREIARAVTDGIGRDGRKLGPPMAYGFYAGLKQADLADIIAWLRTVPPLQ